MHSRTIPLGKLFGFLFLAFVGLLTASLLQAWTGPTGTAPANNVSAPINVSTTDQVKNAGLSVNALSVFGRQYIQSGLNVGTVTANQVTALDVNGTILVGNGGEACQSVTEGAIRYNMSTHAPEYCNGTAWTAFGAASAGQVFTYTTPGTATWTKPSSGSVASIECWGGGGGGGGNGSGGGGGGYVSKTMTFTQLPASVTVTVGAGGTAGSNTQYLCGGYGCGSAGPGGSGGNSSFGSFVVAYGGGGGSSSGIGSGGGGSGGTIEYGGDGGAGWSTPGASTSCSGAGGGGGGDNSYRSSSVTPPGSSGCGGNGGTGGVGGAGVVGGPGTQPGGGGGGEGGITPSDSPGTNGGAGGAGKCVITVS